MNVFTKINKKDEIKILDDQVTFQIYQFIIKLDMEKNPYEVYKMFYKSKYNVRNLTEKEYQLQDELSELTEQYQNYIFRFRIDNDYEWVKIYPSQINKIVYRYYLAPSPEKLHDLVENLTLTMLEMKVAAKFKYQLQDKMEDCDRIIIYCDEEHQSMLEQALQTLYQTKPYLFAGSERALPWIYVSKIPNIYIAPETPGISYGLKFADALIQIKQNIDYLHSVTIDNINEKINYDYELTKTVIMKLLQRNGLLLNNDNMPILENSTIRSNYDYDNGTLTNTYIINDDLKEVNLSPTNEDKKRLIESYELNDSIFLSKNR